MARMLDDAVLPFRVVAPELMGDDEIAVHVEALDDGRDSPERWRTWRAAELQDDEIGSHIEKGELVFALPGRKARRRRPVRH